MIVIPLMAQTCRLPKGMHKQVSVSCTIVTVHAEKEGSMPENREKRSLVAEEAGIMSLA